MNVDTILSLIYHYYLSAISMRLVLVCFKELNKETWCLTSTETRRLITDVEMGIWRWGERVIMYLSLHCHHQNDSCSKMGSDESHFNILLIVRDKVTRIVSTDHNF